MTDAVTDFDRIAAALAQHACTSPRVVCPVCEAGIAALERIEAERKEKP